MQGPISSGIWHQFGASIDTLARALRAIPPAHWEAQPRMRYMAYHTLLFLDYYLTVPPTHFAAGLPYRLVSMDEVPADALDDLLPARAYTQAECLAYLQASRAKCQALLARLSVDDLAQPWICQPDDLAPSSVMEFSVLEILLYNLRHVQHHAAQLNLLLRQLGITPPDTVPSTD
jgi:hypothetical protein